MVDVGARLRRQIQRGSGSVKIVSILKLLFFPIASSLFFLYLSPDPSSVHLCPTDPSKLDGCAYPTCPLPRTREGIPCCAQHRCLQPTCDRVRQVEEGSSFCDQHTCSLPCCNALASSTSSSDDVSNISSPLPPFCDLHRPCAREGCPRRCHTRETTGQTALFCGAHYCSVSDCPNQRKEGSSSSDPFCEEHSCVEIGCNKGRNQVEEGSSNHCRPGARFCADHECHAEEGGGRRCLERVDGRVKGAEYCPLHRCVVEDCSEPATGGEGSGRARCVNHRYCVVEGCKEWVFVERIGEDEVRRHPECEHRELFLFILLTPIIVNNNTWPPREQETTQRLITTTHVDQITPRSSKPSTF